MKVYLMRHCATNGGAQMDAERPLDATGRIQGKTMRKFLKRAQVKADVILSSDFARAQQTAEVMQRKKTPLVTTRWLRPDSTPDAAWNAILELAPHAKSILVVTHGPLIQPLLASVAFCFIDEKWNFEHGSIAYVNTHEARFRWFVTPKLAAHIVGENPAKVENVATIAKECIKLSENLMADARRAVIQPLRNQMHAAVHARWKKQLARVKRALRKGDLTDAATAQAVIASVIPFSDKAFSKRHRIIKSAAYTSGVHHSASQLGINVQGAVQGIEAQGKGTQNPTPNARVSVPEPDYDSIDDQGYDLERELDRTTVDRAHSALGALGDGFTKAAAISAMVSLFAGFEDPGSGKLSRADTVALQTVSDGYHAGGKDLVNEAGDSGLDVMKRWVTGGEACEVCQENEADDWIGADESHSSGDDQPPQHPNCDCSEEYALAKDAE